MALAEAVLTAARDVAEREGMSSVSLVEVRIGELQQITVKTFESCLSLLRAAADPRLHDTELRISIQLARFRCQACDADFALRDVKTLEEDSAEAVHFIPELVHAFVTCPVCQSADFAVVEGRGVCISSVEGTA